MFEKIQELYLDIAINCWQVQREKCKINQRKEKHFLQGKKQWFWDVASQQKQWKPENNEALCSNKLNKLIPILNYTNMSSQKKGKIKTIPGIKEMIKFIANTYYRYYKIHVKESFRQKVGSQKYWKEKRAKEKAMCE